MAKTSNAGAAAALAARSAAMNVKFGLPKKAKVSGKKPVPTPVSAATDPVADMVTAAQLPQKQDIAAQQAASAAAAKAQAESTAGYYKALAGILQGIAPATQNAYQSAAADTSAFGKGFSDGLAHVQSQNDATAANAAGISGGTVPAPSGPAASDALYNIGGYIPATTLAREGAAFTSAAALYPGTAAGQGAATIEGIGNQQVLDQKALGQKLTDLAGQVPGLRLQYQTAYDTQKNAVAKQNLAQAKANADDVYKQSMLQLQYIAATGVDPATGKLTPKAQTAYDKAMNAITVANQRVTIAQQNADANTSRATTTADKARGYTVDGQGNMHVLPGFTQQADGTVTKNPTSSKWTPKQSVVSSVGQMRVNGYTEAEIAAQLQTWHPGWTPAQVAATLKAAPKVFADMTKTQVETLRAQVNGLRSGHPFNPTNPKATVTIGGHIYKAGENIPQIKYGPALAYLIAQGYSRRDAISMLNRFYPKQGK